MKNVKNGGRVQRELAGFFFLFFFCSLGLSGYLYIPIFSFYQTLGILEPSN